MSMSKAFFAISQLHRSPSKRTAGRETASSATAAKAQQRKSSNDGVSAGSVPTVVIRRSTMVSPTQNAAPQPRRTDSLAIQPAPVQAMNLAAPTPSRNNSASSMGSHRSLLRHLDVRTWHHHDQGEPVKTLGYIKTDANGHPPLYVVRGTDLKLPMAPTLNFKYPKGPCPVPGLREIILRFTVKPPSSASATVWQETWEVPAVSYAIPGDLSIPTDARRAEWESSQAWMKVCFQDMFPKADIEYSNKDDRTQSDLMMAGEREVHIREKIRKQKRRQRNAGLKIECRIGGYGVKQAFALLVALHAAKKPVLSSWVSAKAKAQAMQQLGLPNAQ